MKKRNKTESEWILMQKQNGVKNLNLKMKETFIDIKNLRWGG